MPDQPITSQDISFVHRGRIVRVGGVPTTLTVLQWLREHARLPGTKEGCAEGDCGACTVIVAELAGDGAARPGAIRAGELLLRPVNACIRFLPTLHGKALLTVEDLRGAEGAIHPVQQAMVHCHASQCGFCTPGFVMSLVATYTRHTEAGTRPGRQEIADDLSGNLCRCTGYRPILDAGERMFEHEPVRLDTAPIAAMLRGISGAADAGFHYAAANPAHPHEAGCRVDHFHAPRTVAALAALYEANPASRLLAGATDIGLWVNKQFRDVGDLISVTDIPALNHIIRDGATLRIGAAAPLEDAWAALVGMVPPLAEMALRFAGPPVRHAGTMGGNIANGSPIGDAAPVLLALDAVLVLQRGARVRRLPLDAFYIDYMRNALEPGEFLHGFEVPVPSAETVLRAYKISKRLDCDISAVSLGAAITLDGARVRDIRLAFGGMAAIARRAAGAEAALRGAGWDEAALDATIAALAEDFAPLDDLRASKSYRMRVAGNLLRRLWLETRPVDPMPISATRARVFALSGAA